MKVVVDKGIALFSVVGLIFFLLMAGWLVYYFVVFSFWTDYYLLIIFGIVILFLSLMIVLFILLMSTFGRRLDINADGIHDRFLCGKISFLPIESVREIGIAITGFRLKNFIYFSTFELSTKEKRFLLDIAIKRRKSLKIVSYSPERYQLIQNLYPEKIKQSVW